MERSSRVRVAGRHETNRSRHGAGKSSATLGAIVIQNALILQDLKGPRRDKGKDL